MTPTLSRPAALEYAIMRTGAVGEIYDTLDQARAALYRTAAPMDTIRLLSSGFDLMSPNHGRRCRRWSTD